MAAKKDFIQTVEDLYKSAPALPATARDVLVKIAPWVALIFGVLGVIAGVGAIGVTPLALLGGISNSLFLFVSGVLTIVASVLMLMAFPKLRTMKIQGWRLLFWSEVVSVAGSIVTLNVGSVVMGVVIAAIAFYLLFQIKPAYK